MRDRSSMQQLAHVGATTSSNASGPSTKSNPTDRYFTRKAEAFSCKMSKSRHFRIDRTRSELKLRNIDRPVPPPPRWRLAIELSGCMRALNLTAPAKAQGILDARAAAFAVDIFCSLEACSQMELHAARAGLVRDFVAQLAHALGAHGSVVNCSWTAPADGVLGPDGALKQMYRQQFPGYPFHANQYMNVDHLISQARKLQQVAALRRAHSQSAGMPYDLVWRQRPDWVSTGLNFTSVQKALLLGSQRNHDFVVPQVCVAGAHTDMEAVLTTTAADHLSSLFEQLPSLYKAVGSHFAGPEAAVSLHMRSRCDTRAFYHYIQPGWAMYRCSPDCFSHERSPCHRAVPTGPFNKEGTCGVPSTVLPPSGNKTPPSGYRGLCYELAVARPRTAPVSNF